MKRSCVWSLGLEDCAATVVVYICHLSNGGKGQNCQVKFFWGVNFQEFQIVEEL